MGWYEWWKLMNNFLFNFGKPREKADGGKKCKPEDSIIKDTDIIDRGIDIYMNDNDSGSNDDGFSTMPEFTGEEDSSGTVEYPFVENYPENGLTEEEVKVQEKKESTDIDEKQDNRFNVMDDLLKPHLVNVKFKRKDD